MGLIMGEEARPWRLIKSGMRSDEVELNKKRILLNVESKHKGSRPLFRIEMGSESSLLRFCFITTTKVKIFLEKSEN